MGPKSRRVSDLGQARGVPAGDGDVIQRGVPAGDVVDRFAKVDGVAEAELVGEAALVDRAGLPGVATLSKVTGSWPEAVLLLPAGSLTLSAGIVTVTGRRSSG